MKESRSDEISDGWQVFVRMIEEAYDRWFMDFSDGFGMRKHSFGFIDHEIILFFEKHGNLDLRRFIKQNRGEISRDVIDLYLIIVFELIGFLHDLIIHFDASSLDDVVEKASGIGKLLAQSRIYSLSGTFVDGHFVLISC